MKKVLIFCLLSAFMMLTLFGCTQKKSQAVSEQLIQTFLSEETQAAALLELPEGPTEDRSYHIYQKSMEWCGIEMDTEFVYKTGKPFCFTGKKTYPDTQETKALAQKCLSLFKGQLGSPHSCTIYRDGVGKTYGTYIEEGKEQDVEKEGFDTVFSEEATPDRRLTFLFTFPDSDEKDLVFIECSYFREQETPELITFFFQIYTAAAFPSSDSLQ